MFPFYVSVTASTPNTALGFIQINWDGDTTSSRSETVVWDLSICVWVYMRMLCTETKMKCKKLDLSLISRVYRNDRYNWMCSLEGSKRARERQCEQMMYICVYLCVCLFVWTCHSTGNTRILVSASSQQGQCVQLQLTALCLWECVCNGVWVAVRVCTIGRCVKLTIFTTITILCVIHSSIVSTNSIQ